MENEHEDIRITEIIVDSIVLEFENKKIHPKHAIPALVKIIIAYLAATRDNYQFEQFLEALRDDYKDCKIALYKVLSRPDSPTQD